jgi:peptidylprolyl isomerase
MLTLLAGSALAQTTAPAPTPAKPAIHHSLPRRPLTACPALVAPKLPAAIPAVTGKFQSAYALNYIDTKVGTGALAPATGFFTVHYTGYLASDGKKFDSSLDRGEPITFPVGQHRVIPGWDTGFAGMHIGGKRRLFIPYELAYGETGRPPVIPAKSELIFDVELISVSDKAPEPKGPKPPVPPAAVPVKPHMEPDKAVPAPPPADHGTPQAAPAAPPPPTDHGTPQGAPAKQ